MALMTQRFVNAYPSWMKLRKDPSSVGQRFFSSFAEFYDDLGAEKVLLSEMFKLFSEKLDISRIYWVNLEESDYFRVSGWSDYTYPVVTGTLEGGSTVTISRAEDTANFFNDSPTRITSVRSETVPLLIWSSSAPATYNTIKTPCRLGVTVSGSTHYKTLGRDKGFSGYYLVKIEGEDENEQYITDTIYLRDDGTFKTQRIFSKVTSVDSDGFDGTVTVYVEEAYPVYRRDKFHFGVSSTMEGPLYIRGFTATGGTVGIELFSKRMRNGQSYRKDIGVYDIEDIEEILDNQIMKDASGTTYSVVDYTISPLDGKIWCISSDGRVHVHRNSMQEFTVPPKKGTESTAIDIIPEQYRMALNEEGYFWTYFRQIRGPVKEVKIRRIDPDGIETYLQADKATWSASSHSFEGHFDKVSLPEDSWDTLRFTSDIDKLGEWHFYCDATILLGGGAEVTETSHTGVMCGSNQALKSYSLGISSPEKVFFSKENWLTVINGIVGTSGTANYYRLHNDTYIADVRSNRLLLREEYTEVDITYV